MQHTISKSQCVFMFDSFAFTTAALSEVAYYRLLTEHLIPGSANVPEFQSGIPGELGPTRPSSSNQFNGRASLPPSLPGRAPSRPANSSGFSPRSTAGARRSRHVGLEQQMAEAIVGSIQGPGNNIRRAAHGLGP